LSRTPDGEFGWPDKGGRPDHLLRISFNFIQLRRKIAEADSACAQAFVRATGLHPHSKNWRVTSLANCETPPQSLAAMKCVSLLTALVVAAPTFAAPPRSGAAKGSCSIKNQNAVTLTQATAYVDTKRNGKPTVLVISDVKLPVEKWTSEEDIARSSRRFSGAVFVLSKDNQRAEASFYWRGKRYAATYYLRLSLDQKAEGELIGTVATEGEGKSARAQRTKVPGTFSEPIEYLKFKAAFHATLK
jgi:hypothetical protein